MPTEAANERLPLVERYRPTKVAELVGNARARTELRTWANDWLQDRGVPRYRAVLLTGPPGVGKTSAAVALANELGWTLVEMNASESRNEAAIDAVAGRASLTHTLGGSGLFRGAHRGERTLILLDEADCLTGRLGEEARPRLAPISLREFLRGRYGSTELLNRTWGLGVPGAPKSFTSWDGIPQSAGRAAWARWPAAQRDLDEWRSAGKPRDLTDRGGIGAIARLIRETRQPVILTANDETQLSKLASVLRTSARRIRFQRPTEEEIRQRLSTIARSERIALGEDILGQLAHRANGDLRAAINDLEAVRSLDAGSVLGTLGGERDLTIDFYQVTDEALSAARIFRSTEIRDRIDATPDDLFPWIEENLPRLAPTSESRSAALDVLTTADLLLNRARRYRVYGLWSFASELMTGGVSVTLNDRAVPEGRPIAFPQFLGQMGYTRSARQLRLSILAKAGRATHVSRRKGIEAILPILGSIFDPNRPDTASLLRARRRWVRRLDLVAEEVGFLLGKEPDGLYVRRLFSDAPAAHDEPDRIDEERSSGSETTDRKEPRGTQRSLGEF